MRQMETSTRLWKQGLAALGVLAGLALAPAPAQAQVCGDLGDVADDVLDDYFDALEEIILGGLSEKTCDSMRSTFFKACNSAVKDAVKCKDRAISTLPKAAKPACQEASKNPSSCNDFYKEEADNEASFVNDQANFAYDDCEDAAADFWDVCRFGFDE